MSNITEQLAAALRRVLPYLDRVPQSAAVEVRLALHAHQKHEAEVAIVQTPERAASQLRVAWLVERKLNGRTVWRSYTSFAPEAGWSSDANEALQFSRKVDAEAFMSADDGDGEIYLAEPVEHGFHQ